MNKEELKKFDGKEGRSAYFAYKGNVYDVTGSKLWKNGSHINRHFAGEDLTDQLAVAPHKDDVFEKFTLVGKLDADEPDIEVDKMDKQRDWYRKFHPHPVMIHFPMGLFFFTGIMQALFLFSGLESFEKAAFYSLIIAAVTSIPATLSGVYSWWLNYQMMLTKTFKAKLYFSIILIIFGVSATLLRLFVPVNSSDAGLLFYMYNGLVFSTFPLVGIIGFYGGKITWPG